MQLSPQTSTPFELPSLRHFFIFRFGFLHPHSSLQLCSPITSEHTIPVSIDDHPCNTAPSSLHLKSLLPHALDDAAFTH
jgi:hypothetical protein